jgi:hypothetical protein
MRPLAILLLLIWLPLQGVAAAAVPFCDHQPPPAAGPADQHAGHHDAGHGTPDHTALSGACDDCGVCHLACAPAVPSQTTLPGMCAATQHAVFESGTPPPFVPDLLQRPPLARA